MSKIIAATAALATLLSLAACNPGPSFKERCEAAGGTDLTYVTYTPILVGKVIVQSPVYHYRCLGPDGRLLEV